MAIAASGSPSSGSTGSSGATSVTVSHTIPSGSDRYLIVATGIRQTSSQTVSGVTFNGVSMTALGAGISDGIRYLRFFGLVAPDVTTANIVASGSASARIGLIAQAFTGVDQTTPTGTAQEESDAPTTTPSVTLSSATGEMALASGFVSSGDTTTVTLGGTGTEFGNLVVANGAGTNSGLLFGAYAAGAATVQFDWTLGASRTTLLAAIGLLPAGAGTTASPGTGLLTLTGFAPTVTAGSGSAAKAYYYQRFGPGA